MKCQFFLISVFFFLFLENQKIWRQAGKCSRVPRSYELTLSVEIVRLKADSLWKVYIHVLNHPKAGSWSPEEKVFFLLHILLFFPLWKKCSFNMIHLLEENKKERRKFIHHIVYYQIGNVLCNLKISNKKVD